VPHPSAPSALPNSFAEYRIRAQQHGPLSAAGSAAAAVKAQAAAAGFVGHRAGRTLGPPLPTATSGLAFDRNDLPARFHRPRVAFEEIEAVETGGASLV